MRKITQAEIGRKLGISPAAVGAALNGSRGVRVSPETQERVRAMANELGYRPSRAAQILRSGKSGLIGMVQLAGWNRLLGRKALYAAKAAQEGGYQVLTDEIAWYSGLAAWDNMLKMGVEGVLLGATPGWFLDLIIDDIRRTQLPVVAISGEVIPDIPQVRPDVFTGMKELTKYALDKGARKLCLSIPEFISNPMTWPIRERIDGFSAALAERGGCVSFFTIGPEDSQKNIFPDKKAKLQAVVCGTPVPNDIDDLKIGEQSVSLLLDRKERPDVILCSNDLWAQGALAACAERKLRVPDDIRITGYDGEPGSAYGYVPLTTMEQPAEALSRKAVQLLMKQMAGKKLSSKERLVKLPCTLAARTSC